MVSLMSQIFGTGQPPQQPKIIPCQPVKQSQPLPAKPILPQEKTVPNPTTAQPNKPAQSIQPLSAKKIDKSGSFSSLPLRENEKDSNICPTRYHQNNFCFTKIYLASLDAASLACDQNIKLTPRNPLLYCQASRHALISACFCRVQQRKAEQNQKLALIEGHRAYERDWLEAATQKCQEARDLPICSALFYTESMIMEYKGVDCTNLRQVEKYLSLLFTAQKLDPTNKEIQDTLTTIFAFLEKRWTELEEKDAIAQLHAWRQEPLTLTRIIPLEGFSFDCLCNALIENARHPDATQLIIDSDNPVLTMESAQAIRNAMIRYKSEYNKTLIVYLNSSTDLDLLKKTFSDKTILHPKQGSLILQKFEKSEEAGSYTYALSMNTPYVFKTSSCS